ncbi:hypothetical protein HW278_09505 [Capnocytophaga sp. oral taxon 902]|nr:hypothetical protein [Capnocytophaga sp. oral taxon 902]QLF50907.1 hypothetical protein HW278_09505 [Capnocytophaga sp. oral taxon 902]
MALQWLYSGSTVALQRIKDEGMMNNEQRKDEQMMNKRRRKSEGKLKLR